MLSRPSGVSTSSALNETSNGKGSPTMFQLTKRLLPVPLPFKGITIDRSVRALPLVKIGLIDEVSAHNPMPSGNRVRQGSSPSRWGPGNVGLNEAAGSIGPKDV